MTTYVVRTWLPDRPGALGAVASRIGAVRGDLIGIDILERGAGRAIDELVVELPDDALVGLLTSEVEQVDGVDVEDVRRVDGRPPDARLDALEAAAALMGCVSVDEMVSTLVGCAVGSFAAEWAALVDLGAPCVLAAVGSAPPEQWMTAFVSGTRLMVIDGDRGPADLAWADLDQSDAALLVGRGGRSFRTLERRQLCALATIADHRWVELVTRSARLLHPSAS